LKATIDLEHRLLMAAVDTINPPRVISPPQDQDTRAVVFDDRRLAIPALDVSYLGSGIG
jgi:hypothetical protein